MDRPEFSPADLEANVPVATHGALLDFISVLGASDGSKAAVSAAFKEVLAKHAMKMPTLAMPVRYAMFATTQTPAIDAVISLIGKEETIHRLQRSIKIS
jgi:glutamyl-tRNA synthetase